MKILLISPIIAPKRTPTIYNIGLGYIAASLIQDGHDVKVLDLQSRKYKYKDFLKIIREEDYDVIGIGTLITAYKFVKWLVREIRKVKPGVTIWMGNSIASTIPEIIINDMGVDVVILGEGEETVKELARATEGQGDISRVRGIAFKNGKNIIRTAERQLIENIDSIPYPAWDMFAQDVYMNNRVGGLHLPVAHISTTRGCPYSCTYCYHSFQNRRVRMHSAARVVEEIEILKKKYDIKSVGFADDLFMVDKKRVYEVCDLIEKKRLNIKWMAVSRVNTLDKDLLKRMKHAGCISLGFGIESGSQKILDNIKKNATVEQSKEAIRLCRKAGIVPVSSFMIGNIGETRETVFETVSFITKHYLEITSFFITTPYPETELYKYAKSMGKIKDEVSLFESYGEQALNMLVNFTDMPDDDLLKLKKEAEDIILRRFILRRPHKFIYHLWMKLVNYYHNYGALRTFKRILRLQ